MAQRALPDWHVSVLSSETPSPCLAPSERVSYSCVHTPPTPLSCALIHTTHHAPLSIQAEHASYTATQHNPSAPLHLAGHTPQYMKHTHNAPSTPQQAHATTHTTSQCCTQVPTPTRPPQISQYSTDITTAQHTSQYLCSPQHNTYTVYHNTHT